jgi:hypothetical protein
MTAIAIVPKRGLLWRGCRFSSRLAVSLRFAFFRLGVFSSALRLRLVPHLTFAFHAWLGSIAQLHPQSLVLGPKLLHFSFHPLGIGPQFPDFGLHSLRVRSENLPEGSAHLLGASGDDFSDLPFHLLRAWRRPVPLALPAQAKTLLFFGAANGAISSGFRAFPDLPRVGAHVSFGRSSLSFVPWCKFALAAPDIFPAHNYPAAFGTVCCAVAWALGLDARDPVVAALTCRGDHERLALSQLASRHSKIFIVSRDQNCHLVVTFERLDHDAQMALLIDLLLDKPDEGPAHLAYSAAFLRSQHTAGYQRGEQDCIAQLFHSDSPSE